MDNVIQRAPTVGSVIKKMLAIHPHLGADEIIDFIKKSTLIRSPSDSAAAPEEVIDEARALRLAWAARPPLKIVK